MSQGMSLPNPAPRRSFEIRRRPGAAQIVAASGLPAPLGQLVSTVTKRCRLWRSERADVARELADGVRLVLESMPPHKRVIDRHIAAGCVFDEERDVRRQIKQRLQ